MSKRYFSDNLEPLSEVFSNYLNPTDLEKTFEPPWAISKQLDMDKKWHNQIFCCIQPKDTGTKLFESLIPNVLRFVSLSFGSDTVYFILLPKHPFCIDSLNIGLRAHACKKPVNGYSFTLYCRPMGGLLPPKVMQKLASIIQERHELEKKNLPTTIPDAAPAQPDSPKEETAGNNQQVDSSAQVPAVESGKKDQSDLAMAKIRNCVAWMNQKGWKCHDQVGAPQNFIYKYREALSLCALSHSHYSNETEPFPHDDFTGLLGLLASSGIKRVTVDTVSQSPMFGSTPGSFLFKHPESKKEFRLVVNFNDPLETTHVGSIDISFKLENSYTGVVAKYFPSYLKTYALPDLPPYLHEFSFNPPLTKMGLANPCEEKTMNNNQSNHPFIRPYDNKIGKDIPANAQLTKSQEYISYLNQRGWKFNHTVNVPSNLESSFTEYANRQCNSPLILPIDHLTILFDWLASVGVRNVTISDANSKLGSSGVFFLEHPILHKNFMVQANLGGGGGAGAPMNIVSITFDFGDSGGALPPAQYFPALKTFNLGFVGQTQACYPYGARYWSAGRYMPSFPLISEEQIWDEIKQVQKSYKKSLLASILRKVIMKHSTGFTQEELRALDTLEHAWAKLYK